MVAFARECPRVPTQRGCDPRFSMEPFREGFTHHGGSASRTGCQGTSRGAGARSGYGADWPIACDDVLCLPAGVAGDEDDAPERVCGPPERCSPRAIRCPPGPVKWSGVPASDATASGSAHDSNGRRSRRRGCGLSTPTFAGLTSIIPQTTPRSSTCRNACVASKRYPVALTKSALPSVLAVSAPNASLCDDECLRHRCGAGVGRVARLRRGHYARASTRDVDDRCADRAAATRCKRNNDKIACEKH